MSAAISRSRDRYGQVRATNQYEAIYAQHRSSQLNVLHSEVLPYGDNGSRYMGHDKNYALHNGTPSHVHYRKETRIFRAYRSDESDSVLTSR